MTIFSIAENQQGFFTSFQAKQAGITDNNHVYHVRKGNWIREWRGIYRLRDYPFQEDAQYALWGVWSMNRKGDIQGVFSHETALSLFELSDINPVKLHMTVPRTFRRHSKIPTVLKLHYSTVMPTEYDDHGGYKVTKLFRTVADLIRCGTVSNEFIVQAVKEGLKRGILTNRQYETLKEIPRVGSIFKKIMKE